MLTDIRSQCRADGFARGLLKCAMAGAAGRAVVDPLMDAARVFVNPATKGTAEAFGRDVFRHATDTSKPIGAFGHFLFGQHPQIKNIASVLHDYANALHGATPEGRVAMEAARDQILREQFAELGTAAAKPIRAMQNVKRVGAGLGVGGLAGLVGGNVMGHRDQAASDVESMQNLPIHRRLQYALFPQSIFPQKPKPVYEREPDQTGQF